MIRKKIDVIHRSDSIYPESLLSLPKPPDKLYYIGDPTLMNSRTVGIVGSRKFTLYGKVIAKAAGRLMSDAGVSVVSGLAYGIDAFSHDGVRENGGRAIAVLGMGHDLFAPYQNRELFEWVCENGLAVSEYEPDFRGSKYSFPQRNRIISALSEKLIVIEAGYKSGALITAQYAAELGKEVYAVPGNINSQFSAGTNLLIRDGAKPLIVLDDVLTDMGIAAKETDGGAGVSLDAEEVPIYNSVASHSGVTANEISMECGVKAERVSAILTVLEIKGAVYSYAGKFHLAK